jgi:hypothetical protein
MSTRHLLDPELLAFVDATPAADMSDELLSMAREATLALPQPDNPDEFGVSREEVFISCDNAPDVRCLVYRQRPNRINTQVICTSTVVDMSWHQLITSMHSTQKPAQNSAWLSFPSTIGWHRNIRSPLHWMTVTLLLAGCIKMPRI